MPYKFCFCSIEQQVPSKPQTKLPEAFSESSVCSDKFQRRQRLAGWGGGGRWVPGTLPGLKRLPELHNMIHLVKRWNQGHRTSHSKDHYYATLTPRYCVLLWSKSKMLWINKKYSLSIFSIHSIYLFLSLRCLVGPMLFQRTNHISKTKLYLFIYFKTTSPS